MKTRLIASAAATMLMAHAAEATVYFNSTTVTNPSAGADGQGDGNAYAAASFTASSPNFNQIALTLFDTNPADSGSVLVYLVPDDGTGINKGTAGRPVTTAPTPAANRLIGTIADAALSSNPSLVTVFLSPSAASISTPNQEYWVELQFSAGSAAAWEYGGGGSFVGSAGQATLDTQVPVSSDTAGAYDMVVSTPEPASLAVLGAAIAGLSLVRRRGAKQA